MRLLLCLIFLAAVVWGGLGLIPCYRECDLRLMSDEDDFDVTCNETCKIQKCHEGCALFTNAILSSCHEVCQEERKIFNKKNKMNLYCTRGCNIAINIYMKAIEDEVGTPAEPYLVAETRTNTSIRIKWTPSAYENISYLVQLRYDGAHHLTDWEYYRPSFLLKDNYLTVEDLHPYSKYRFRVAWIILQNYPPLFSEESIVISTLPYGAPSTPPVITCLTAVSCSRVSLSWDPPPFPNGPILSYVLYIEKFPDGNIMIKDISDTSDGLHYMINNLESYTKYKISLSTRNSMGEGPADVRNITTLSKKDISSLHHTPAYLLFGSKRCVLKQGLKILDESEVLYKVNESISVTGVALHVKNNLFFVSDSQGNVHRVTMKKNKSNTVIHSSVNHPTILSLDWLHEKLYMAEETEITRCDTDGSNYQVVLKNMKYRAEDMHVDPLNGYLYMTVTDHVSGGGLYRIDLMEFDNGLVLFDKTQLIVSDYELTAFVVDYKNFRILLPSSTNNSIVSIALDGSDISDIRENSQTHLYKNIKSVAVHQDLLYYTRGNFLYGEEYHKKEDKFYNNVYLVNGGPFLSLNVHHSDNQPYPIPLNPVESVQALFESEIARISWLSPRLLGGQGKGAYQKWSYEVELLDHVNFLTVLGVNISHNFYDVNNLNPNTTYSVKVRAYSDGGKGPFSTEFTGSTLKSYESDEKPYILYGAREGLLRSDFIGQKVEPLILKMNLNNAYITDICWYDKMLFINTNTTFVYVYNTSLTRLQNITMATSIAIDWFAPKLYYSSAATQMISRSNIDGSQPEPLPILAIAKEIAIDSLNAYLYWATPYSVERSRLNGMDHYVYMKNALFSGRMVMGLTLDFEKKKLYYMVRSYEGSIMYRSCLADMIGTTCGNGQEPEIVGYLSEDGLHGPVRYFNNRVYWQHENRKAFVSDVNGRNFAYIKGLGLSGLTSMEIIDSSLQPYPDGLSLKTIKVVPPAISEDAIHINGTHDIFNITWEPVLSLNYGVIFYEVRVDDGDEVYSLITNDTFFLYPTMKRLPPFTPLTIGMKAFTYYASSKQTIVSLNSPMSIPSKPLHPRVFITHKSSPFHHNEDIVADFRWSPPAEANGIILNYGIKCWLIENKTEVLVCDSLVDGKILQFQTSDLLPNCTYYFQVHATTQAGAGKPADVEIETSVERPVPQLLLANTDSLKVADIDLNQEKLLFGKATHPAAIAYLAVEKTVFWVEEGALMVSSIDGTNASLIKHLTSEGTSLSVDWIGRLLYWVEVNKKEGYSCVWSADLSYNSYRNIFNSSSIIHNLEVEPFSRSLIWTSASHNNWILMMSDISGSNIRPFFSQTLEYQSSVSKMKVKRTKTLNNSCNCNGFESVGEAMAIDSTNTSELKILYVDGKLGHIWSSDISGCRCQMLLNASLNYNSGLPPTSITVDNSNIYYSNKTQGKVYSITKNFSNHIDLHPHVEEEIRGIRSIRAIGHHLQPYPDASCLISESYENKAELISSTSHSLIIFLPLMRRPMFCSTISSPSLLYTIYYGPSDDADTHTCLNKNQRNLCKSMNTHNNTVVLSDLQPFTNYSIKLTVKNYYSKGFVPLGPEAIYQTAVGTPSPPMNVTAKAITPFRIDVNWEPPSLPNGEYIFFEIRWKVKDPSKDSRSTIQSECGKDSNSDLSANIITTETGKDHCITVRAYSLDCKMYSDSEEIYVTAFPLPNNLTFVNSSSSSLKLSWKSPNDDSISNYFVEYSDDEMKWYSTSPVEIEAAVSTNYAIFVENLTPKTKYICRLVLEYRGKNMFIWPQSYNFHFLTSGDVPSSPGSPQAKKIAREVYQISWIEAFNNGYLDIVYELEMRSELETRDWIYVINSSSTQYIINNFSGNTAHYEFRVRAINEFGASNFIYSEKPFYIPEARALIDAADDPFGIIIASSVAVVILLCVFFATLYMIYLKKEKCKKILQDVAPSNQLVSDIELATLQDLPLHANFVHQTNALYNLNDLPTDEELIALPQIHRDQIIVTKFLGSGAFGEVFEGIACGLREDVPSLKIAIKTLKKGATDHEKEEFLKEAKLMSNFKHDHILQLLGVCFDNNPNFIILELMEGGDLLSYLRSNRPTVFESSNLTMDDLIQICIDVAEGCKYLEDMHFVHRDLAARNCLVSSYDRDQRIVKIGDFGLARDIYKNDYYRKEGEGLLPVRWMAPESLVYGVFSNESDVWAFGVLLWEVITLGMQPYPARSNMEVLYYVRAGGRLEKPENCPDDLHETMLRCWSYDSDSRPTFCYCLHALKEIRTKLVSSTIEMPSVYNFNYFNQRNLGAYIGRHDEDTDENKLLDPNFDSRSTQSDPPTTSDIIPEANPASMRRSLSWTSAMFQSSEMPVTSAMKLSAKLKGRKLTNKYLELLGDNQDSDGYQLPLQCNKSLQKTLPISKKKIYLANVTSSSSQVTSPSLLNHRASVSDLSDCESSTNLPSDSTHEQSSASNELDLMLENFERDRSTSMSTPDSNHSWLEDCDKWSFSTASTATCPLDFTLNSQNNDNIVSASSCIGGVDLDHSLKSSYC